MTGHSRVTRALPGIAVAAVITAYYAARCADAVGMFFFVDDFWLMRDAHDLHQGSGWPLVEVFRPNHNGFLLYRPLTGVGYYYVLRQLFGVDASPYHAAQLRHFAFNACLVAAIVRTLTASWGWALAGGLLYAAAPDAGRRSLLGVAPSRGHRRARGVCGRLSLSGSGKRRRAA